MKRDEAHEEPERPKRVCHGAHDIDGSLVLSMERTVYAALNQAWMLILTGIGFMSIGAKNDLIPDYLGAFILVVAIIFAAGSYIVHVCRLHAFSHGSRALSGVVTKVWIGLLVFTIVGALVLELQYAIRYPYLSRAKSVELVGADTSAIANATSNFLRTIP